MIYPLVGRAEGALISPGHPARASRDSNYNRPVAIQLFNPADSAR